METKTNSLTTTDYNKPFIVRMDNKPATAAASENVKIRDIPEAQRTEEIYKLVQSLLNVLGIADRNASEHHVELIKFLKDDAVSWTIEEVKLAFKLYMKGEFTENGKVMAAYSKLDVATYCKVMRSYNEKIREELRSYRLLKAKQMNSQEEKSKREARDLDIKSIYQDFEHFLENKEHRFESKGYEATFDFLKHEGIFDDRDKAKRWYSRCYRLAKEEIAKENEKDKEEKGRRRYKEIKEEIAKAHSRVVVIIAKRIAVKEYFAKLVETNRDIKDILKP